MPWVWSDELASAAEAAGVSAAEMEGWRTHPVAFKRPPDADLLRLARSLLSLPEPAGEGDSVAPDAESTEPCSCGGAPLASAGRHAGA